jgi:hypothetical protein
MKLGEILVAAKVADGSVIEKGLAHAKATGQRLGSALIELELVPVDTVARALARQHGVTAATEAHLLAVARDPGLVNLVPVAIARKHCLVPLAVLPDRHEAVIAMSDPKDLPVLDSIAFSSGRKIRAAVASQRRIREAIDLLYGAELNAPSRDAGELSLADVKPLGKKVATAATHPAAAPTRPARPQVSGRRNAFSGLVLFLLLAGGLFIAFKTFFGKPDGVAISGPFDDDLTGLSFQVPEGGWHYLPEGDRTTRVKGGVMRTSDFYLGSDATAPEVGLVVGTYTVEEPLPDGLSDLEFATTIMPQLEGIAEQATARFGGHDIHCKRSHAREGQVASCEGPGSYEGRDVSVEMFGWVAGPDVLDLATFMTLSDPDDLEDDVARILPSVTNSDS